jgi:transposase
MDTSNPTALSVSSRKALPPAKRQHRSPELKRRIVQETLAPGASVARVARAHGVNANQVFAWRRQFRQGLLAVRVAEPEPARSARSELRRRVAEASARSQDAATQRTPSGTIQIELPKVRLRLTGSIDPETLRVVLEALRG